MNNFASATGLTNAAIQAVARPGTQGYDPVSLFRWRMAISRVLTGTGPAYWLIAGASAAAGVGSGTDAFLISGCAARNYNYRTAQRLNSFLQSQAGTTNQYVRQGFCADGNGSIFQGYGYGGSFIAAVNGADPRVVLTGATALTAQFAFGGNAIVLATGGTVSYTPAGFNGGSTFTNAFIVIYERITGSGALSVLVNGATTGVSPTSIATNGTDSIQKATITCTRATGNVLKLTATTGPVRILAIIDQDTTIPAVHMLNGGISGSVLANWGQSENAGTVSSAYNFISFMLPDLLTCTDYPVNDCVAAYATNPNSPPAQVITDFLSLIALGQASGSVIYLSPYLCGPTIAPQADQQNYTAAMIAAAQNATSYSQNGIPVIVAAEQIPYTDSVAYGFLSTADYEHPLYAGHDSIAVGQNIALTNLG